MKNDFNNDGTEGLFVKIACNAYEINTSEGDKGLLKEVARFSLDANNAKVRVMIVFDCRKK